MIMDANAQSHKLYIMDARPNVNAVANKVTSYIQISFKYSNFLLYYEVFTLPKNETETETDTENKYTELCVVIFLCSVWTSPHNPMQPIFIRLGIGLDVG